MIKHLLLVLPLILSETSFGQAYIPLGKPKVAASGLGAGPTLQCAPSDIPTAAQLKTKKFDTHMAIITASQAASLNITFGAIALSGNADQLLAVSDSGRSAPCTATDGKTTVYYGQSIRTVIAMNDYTVKAGASIAIVAATATVSGKTNSVDLYEIGFGDPGLDAKLVAAKATVGGSGITIENYSSFLTAFNAADTYAVSLTNPGIDIVAYDGLTNNFGDALADAWAIQSIAQGTACESAVKGFKQTLQSFQDDIRNVYTQLTGGCSGVDAVGKAKAQQILNGLKIKY